MDPIKKILALLIVLFSLGNVCFSQPDEPIKSTLTTKFDAVHKKMALDSVSKKLSLIPNESLFDTIYVMINDEITPFEANMLISEVKNEKEVRDKVDFYNLVLYRKLNLILEQLVQENSDPYIVLMRERDISEADINSVRFVITTDFSSKNIIRENFRFSFYVYDRAKDLNYQSTSNLIELFDKYKLCRSVFKLNSEVPPSQSQVNKFAYLKKQKEPKEKREMSTAGAWVVGGVIYAVVVLGINYLANL